MACVVMPSLPRRDACHTVKTWNRILDWRLMMNFAFPNLVQCRCWLSGCKKNVTTFGKFEILVGARVWRAFNPARFFTTWTKRQLHSLDCCTFSCSTRLCACHHNAPFHCTLDDNPANGTRPIPLTARKRCVHANEDDSRLLGRNRNALVWMMLLRLVTLSFPLASKVILFPMHWTTNARVAQAEFHLQQEHKEHSFSANARSTRIEDGIETSRFWMTCCCTCAVMFHFSFHLPTGSSSSLHARR